MLKSASLLQSFSRLLATNTFCETISVVLPTANRQRNPKTPPDWSVSYLPGSVMMCVHILRVHLFLFLLRWLQLHLYLRRRMLQRRLKDGHPTRLRARWHFSCGGDGLDSTANHTRHGRRRELNKRHVEVTRHAVIAADEGDAQSQIATVSDRASQYDRRLRGVVDDPTATVAVCVELSRGRGDELAHHVEGTLQVLSTCYVEYRHGLEFLLAVGGQLCESKVAVYEGTPHGGNSHSDRARVENAAVLSITEGISDPTARRLRLLGLALRQYGRHAVLSGSLLNGICCLFSNPTTPYPLDFLHELSLLNLAADLMLLEEANVIGGLRQDCAFSSLS